MVDSEVIEMMNAVYRILAAFAEVVEEIHKRVSALEAIVYDTAD